MSLLIKASIKIRLVNCLKGRPLITSVNTAMVLTLCILFFLSESSFILFSRPYPTPKRFYLFFVEKSFYWQQYFGHKCRIGNSYKVDLYDTIIHIVAASLQIKMQLYSLQPHKSHDEISFIDKWLSLSIPNRNKTERMTPNIKCYKLPKSRIVYWFFSVPRETSIHKGYHRNQGPEFWFRICEWF